MSWPEAPLRKRTYGLQDGDWGVERTVRWMYALAGGSEGATHPAVRTAAKQATEGLAADDFQGRTAALFNLVKTSIQFQQDEDTMQQLGLPNAEDTELLQTP